MNTLSDIKKLLPEALKSTTSTVKKAALLMLGIVTFGFILFSFATIGLTVLGIAAVLAIVGFMARPLLPKAPRKPVIIDVAAIHPAA